MSRNENHHHSDPTYITDGSDLQDLIKIAGQPHALAELLSEPGDIEVIAEAILDEHPSPVFELGDLTYCNSKTRQFILQLVNRTAGLCRKPGNTNEFEYLSLLDFLINSLVGDDEPRRCGSTVTACLEAATLQHPDNLTAACSKVMNRLKKLKVSGYSHAKLMAAADSLRLNHGVQAPLGDEVVLTKVLPDCPTREDILAPPGYLISLAGVECISIKRHEQVSSSPIIATEVYRNASTGEQSLALAFWKDSKWHRIVAERRTIADARAIVVLASQGFPVHSNNAKALVQYLHDFEVANGEYLPVASITNRMGYHGVESEEVFLLGREQLRSENFLESDEPSTRRYILSEANSGETQIARSFQSRGEFDKWLEAIAPALNYPQVRFSCFACLAAPLLEIFNVGNFVVDICGPTSRGKTSALRICASAFGNPFDDSDYCVLSNWNSTRVAVERELSFRHSLPTFLDDTKLAKQDDFVAQILYDVASGRGRRRGARQGSESTANYRGVMLISGEGAATSCSRDGGAYARTLTLWGGPFGEPSEAVGQLLSRIDDDIRANHGLCAERFIQFLLSNRECWEDWREEFRCNLSRLLDRAGNNSVARRLSPALAVIQMAARLFADIVKDRWEYADPVDPLYESLTAEYGEADRGAAALKAIYEWSVANREKFFDISGSRQTSPHDGWVGRWDRSVSVATAIRTSDHRSTLTPGFVSARLNEILTSLGFDPDSTRRDWQSRGWLLRSPTEKRWRIRRLLGSESIWMIVLSSEAIQEVCDVDGSDEDDLL